MRVLVTGAAGFIGSTVTGALRARGHEVVGLDAYIPQAHGDIVETDPAIARIDVRDQPAVESILRGVDVVCHQAAMVGAGVTPADLPLYGSHNDLGTATLLAAMAAAGRSRLVLASSMVVYGDGRYACPLHGDQAAGVRSLDALRAGLFEVSCPQCDGVLEWRAVREDAPLVPRSSYAASKVAQEHYVAAWVRQAAGSAVALRYHNVYGPGMPADTPYSGVAAMFRSALEHGDAPRVFEDGRQMRDFVHVHDVAAVNVLAVEAVAVSALDTMTTFNVCSGFPVSIVDVARLVGHGVSGGPIEPVVTGEFRAGDVRHIVASPEKARQVLGFEAQVAPADGLPRFAREPLRYRAAATNP